MFITTTTSRVLHLVAAGVGTLGLAAALTFVGTGSASAAGTGTAEADPCLTVRDSASTSGGNLGCVPNGTSITVDCTTTGDNVSGPWGDSTVWDHTTYNGVTGYVADAWVYTGTSQPIAGDCGGGSTREQGAIGWLNANAGSTAYNDLCETMVENAYGVSGKYPTAAADYAAQSAAGAIHTDTNAPAGALVFFDGDSSAGHVEISNGDGQYWTSDGDIHLVDLSWGGAYYGWSYAPADW